MIFSAVYLTSTSQPHFRHLQDIGNTTFEYIRNSVGVQDKHIRNSTMSTKRANELVNRTPETSETHPKHAVGRPKEFTFPSEIWLEVLKQLDNKALKKMYRVSKAFTHMLGDKVFDPALFRITEANKDQNITKANSHMLRGLIPLSSHPVSKERLANLRVHPFLKNAGLYIDFYLATTLYVTGRFMQTRGLLRIAPVLGTSTAEESAFWPPCWKAHMVPRLDDQSMFHHFDKPIIGTGTHGMVTVQDVVQILIQQYCRFFFTLQQRSFSRWRLRLGLRKEMTNDTYCPLLIVPWQRVST